MLTTVPRLAPQVPNTSEVAWLKESIYNGRSVKLELEVRDAQLRYFKRPGKKGIKEI